MKIKKRILTNITMLMFTGITIVAQLSTVSCVVVQNANHNSELQAIVKEKDIINKIDQNSQLTLSEKKDQKQKQQQKYEGLSLDNINDYLIQNMNMSLKDYFVNLNLHNNLIQDDPNYIDPDLGVLLVEDILNGDILIEDINNNFEEFKENNHEEYVQILNDMNLTEEQVEDTKNIEEIIAKDPEDQVIDEEFESIQNGTYEEEVVYDEMFELNNRYQEDQMVYIDFIQEGNFFDYRNYESLESRYVEEHDLYFETPLTVTVEMSDGAKIQLENFDIYELEWIYDEYGFF